MTSNQPSSGDRPSSAEDAYALLLKLRESGSAPDFETWVRAYPEYERELRALEESWASIEGSLGRLLASTVIVPPEPLVASLEPGLVVGEFTLVRRIGVGGMGVVWLARQPVLDRDVALKFVRPDRETAQSAQLFAREARAAGRARDPRIVTIYAVGESGGHRWLAQEYVPGSRGVVHWLRKLQDSGVPSDHERRVAAFVADVAEALHGAHLLGVVHRDVKPQNLLMAPDGSPKITDFGLARLLDEVPLSESLTIRGTVEYSSPEQVTGANDLIDARSDVFSLGVVLYELLALERPFTGMGVLEIIAAITVREARPPSALRPGLARELDVIALKALEKQPEARYASALEFAKDLRRWLAHEPIAARPPGAWRRLVKWMRRHPMQAVVSAATVLLLVVTAIFAKRLHDQSEAYAVQLGRQYVVQALWDIDSGKLDAAAEQVASFYGLGLEDPEAHLVMAMGHARYLRFTEAEQELERAVQLGFSPELPEVPDGRDHYLRGLWLLAQRGEERNLEAETELTLAVGLDGDLTQVWLPLYQLRHSLGDKDGARVALQNFHRSTPQSNDYWSVSQALLARLDGDHDAAIKILLDLRERVTDERATELRLHRHLGFAYLGNCLEVALEDSSRVDPAQLDAAERYLEQAVKDTPREGNAIAALGLVKKLRADTEADVDSKRRLLDEAEALAQRAIGERSGLERSAELQAMLAYDYLACDFDSRTIDEGDLDAIEERLERLRDLAPDSRSIPILESGLAYYRGAFANDRGDFEAAVEYFEDSTSRSERQFYARVLLGQRLIEDRKEFAAAEVLFREALDLWDRRLTGVPGEDPARERKWLLAASVWLFAAADQSGNLETARRARDRAIDELRQDDRGMETAEMLTLAEYLAAAKHHDLRDCDLALQLVEDRDLEAIWGGHGEGRRVLDKIHGHCAR